jgi:hypothetical protein
MKSITLSTPTHRPLSEQLSYSSEKRFQKDQLVTLKRLSITVLDDKVKFMTFLKFIRVIKMFTDNW